MDRRPHVTTMTRRRPFWLPASNYYVLTAAVSIAFFFLLWGILRDEGDETPWVTSGVGASIILGGAAVLREVILRRARNNYLRLERRVKDNFSEVRGSSATDAAAANSLWKKTERYLRRSNKNPTRQRS